MPDEEAMPDEGVKLDSLEGTRILVRSLKRSIAKRLKEGELVSPGELVQVRRLEVAIENDQDFERARELTREP